MNERFVAVSTFTGSMICGCFSKPRCDFSVTRGWQQMMNAIRWIKQLAETITAKCVQIRNLDWIYLRWRPALSVCSGFLFLLYACAASVQFI